MKKLIGIFLCLLYQITYAQTIVGSVLDEQDEPLIGVTIINTNSKKGVVTDVNGNFTINTLTNDFLKLSFIGKANLVYRVPITKQDTIYKLFTLKENSKELKEFTVSSKRINKVAGEKNEYILDYHLLLDGNIVVLKKIKKTYYLSLEGIDTVYSQAKLDYNKPLKITEDCFGNIHLICKDSVRQFWVNNQIQCLYSYSHESYNELLKPMIHCQDDYAIAEQFSNHNKKYQLTLVKKGHPKRRLFYQTWDKEAEKVAASWYYQIIGYYYANTSPEMNLIENGIWDGNVISLQISGDIESTTMVSWYLKIKAREMNIQSFSENKGIVLFDLQEDSVSCIDKTGRISSKVNSGIKNINLSTSVIQDKLLEKYYYYQGSKGWLYLYELNPKTGKSQLVLELKEVTFVKHIKIMDGWVYFVRSKNNGFQKLYRVKLEI
mgnify:CR=1 FL=1